MNYNCFNKLSKLGLPCLFSQAIRCDWLCEGSYVKKLKLYTGGKVSFEYDIASV